MTPQEHQPVKSCAGTRRIRIQWLDYGFLEHSALLDCRQFLPSEADRVIGLQNLTTAAARSTTASHGKTSNAAAVLSRGLLDYIAL